MKLLEIILSSAVLVAMITMIKQNKLNRLQYITNERSQWRKEIKEIAEEIAVAKKNEIAKPLCRLKVRLNGYGVNVKNNLQELDFFKDKHIWKVIYRMESKNCSYDEFLELREKLIKYLALLLKFDWERSKSEVRSKSIIGVSISLFIISIVIHLMNNYGFQRLQGMFRTVGDIFYEEGKYVTGLKQAMTDVEVLMLLYTFAWAEYIIEFLFRIKKWYMISSLSFWITYLIAYIGGFCYFFQLNGLGIDFNIEALLFMISIFIPLGCIASLREPYQQFDAGISEILRFNSVNVYTNNDVIEEWRVKRALITIGIRYTIAEMEKDIIKEDENWTEVKSLILDKDDNELKAAFKLLNFSSFLCYIPKYLLSKRTHVDEKQVNIDKFITENPDRCKIIVVYKDDNGTLHATAGLSKKIWKQWMDE